MEEMDLTIGGITGGYMWPDDRTMGPKDGDDDGGGYTKDSQYSGDFSGYSGDLSS